jgi:hypothetical protein
MILGKVQWYPRKNKFSQRQTGNTSLSFCFVSNLTLSKDGQKTTITVNQFPYHFTFEFSVLINSNQPRIVHDTLIHFLTKIFHCSSFIDFGYWYTMVLGDVQWRNEKNNKFPYQAKQK